MPKAAHRPAPHRTPTSYAMKPETRRLIAARAKAWRRSQSSYLEELVYAEAGRPSTIPLVPRTYTPTAAEKRAIEKGRQSPSLTIEDFFAHVERLAEKSRRQNSRPRPRKGA